MQYDDKCTLWQPITGRTRLISIESQPKKIFVVVVVVIGVIIGKHTFKVWL